MPHFPAYPVDPHEGPHTRRTAGRMSNASGRTVPGTESRMDRLQPWIAGLASALLHVMILLFAMLAPPITVSAPQGGATGSVVEVNFIDEIPAAAQSANADAAASTATADRPVPRPPDPTPAKPSPTALRIQPPPVARADEPVQAAAREAAAAPAAPQPRTSTRPGHTFGEPPGMRQQGVAPASAGQPRRATADRGSHAPAPGTQPNLEVGGYQVLYDLRLEDKLRGWRDAGVTELFLPLPGTTQFMVCPLETALKRESGPCRMLDRNDPEMANIGDARQVITMYQVRRRGELVWRGPGAYR